MSTSARPRRLRRCPARLVGIVVRAECARARLAILVVATALLASALSAQTGGARASHALAIVSAGTPRVLPEGQEVRVPLVLRNEGSRVWEPSDFHVSYHWLTRSGVSTGIEGLRTDLPRPVGPGETVDVAARLAAPEAWGVYRLQWDMVQEGVAWFSERDPAAPASVMLLVWPHGMALLGPAPVVTAILLWWFVRRRRIRGSDPSPNGLGSLLCWSALSLVVKQLIAIDETRIAVDTPLLSMSLVGALVPGAVAGILPGRRLRPWVMWGVTCLGSLVLWADLVYFRYFGDVLSAPVFASTGQAGEVGDSIRTLIAGRDVWLFADVPVAILLAWESMRMTAHAAAASWIGRGPGRVAAAVVCALAALLFLPVLPSASGVDATEQVFTNLAVVGRLGPIGYHLGDGWAYLRARWLRPPLAAQGRSEVEAWFARRAPLRRGTGPFFGVARGRNLLVVQVESLQGFMVGLRINGQEVTPNLNRWRNEGVWFSNVTDQTSEGRTSDAELTSLVSLLPLEHGAAAFHYPANHFTGLPHVLANHGYTTLSAVPFGASFWNRRATHPSYGFARSLFAPDFAPGEVIGWGLNDADFLHQMVPKLQELPKPFMAWLITLSLHHPFASFPDAHKVLDVGEWANTPFGNYLHTMRFLDSALGRLREELSQAGLADDTVVMVFGDHDAGFAWEGPLAQTIGFPAHVLDWYLEDRVPWILLVPGEVGPRGEITRRAGQTDIAPTLLALLGIDPAPLPYMGRNLLGEPGEGVVVRPYGGWADGRLFFDGEAPQPDRRCYDIAARENLPVHHCGLGAAESALAREISRRVLTYDLQADLAR